MERSALEISLELLLELCEVDLESKAADLIRDEMDGPWYQMTESEQTLVGKISSKLKQYVQESIVVTPLNELKAEINSEGIGSFPIHKVFKINRIHIEQSALDAMAESEKKLEESYEAQMEKDKRARKFVRDE